MGAVCCVRASFQGQLLFQAGSVAKEGHQSLVLKHLCTWSVPGCSVSPLRHGLQVTLQAAYRSPYRFVYRRAYRSRTSGHESLLTPLFEKYWFLFLSERAKGAEKALCGCAIPLMPGFMQQKRHWKKLAIESMLRRRAILRMLSWKKLLTLAIEQRLNLKQNLSLMLLAN